VTLAKENWEIKTSSRSCVLKTFASIKSKKTLSTHPGQASLVSLVHPEISPTRHLSRHGFPSTQIPRVVEGHPLGDRGIRLFTG